MKILKHFHTLNLYLPDLLLPNTTLHITSEVILDETIHNKRTYNKFMSLDYWNDKVNLKWYHWKKLWISNIFRAVTFYNFGRSFCFPRKTFRTKARRVFLFLKVEGMLYILMQSKRALSQNAINDWYQQKNI